jgi:DNA polymerase (family 10)
VGTRHRVCPPPWAIPEIVPLLIEFGRRTALAGGNPFRAKAYLRAAESLAAQTEPIEKLIQDDRLQGDSEHWRRIAGIITKLASTGTHPSLEKMRKEVP